VTHIGGCPADLDPILDIAAEHDIPLVEDCAQSHGAVYKGRMVGSFGAIAAFSTMFSKHHSTGAQGGVVFTRDATLFAKAKRIADRGKSPAPGGGVANLVGTLNFNQDELDMAMGRVQLAKLPGFIAARRAFARKIETGLRDMEGVSFLGDPVYGLNSYLYLMVMLDRSKIACNSFQFAQALVGEGIDCAQAGYSFYPTEQRWHQDAMVFGKSGLPWSLHQAKPAHFALPNAHAANDSMVRLEIHERLGEREARDMLAAIAKIAGHYRRT
jgi:perosamine synthetase